MKEISAVPFSALPVTDDGYTLLNENDIVHRSSKKLSELVGDKTSSFITDDDISGKLDTTAFSTVSGNFLTAHQSLDEYATQEWVEGEISKIGSYVIVNETTGEDNHPVVENPSTKVIYLTKQTEGKFDNYNEWIYKDETDTFECIGETTLDLENYYRKTETSGKEEIEAALEEKQDKLTFAGTNNTITSINNSAIQGGGTGESNSWKQFSEEHGSSGTLDGEDFCVYLGSDNTAYNASNIIGHNNKALNSNIFGNSNTIDKNLASDSSLSAEQYIKSGYNPITYEVESATVYIRNFVAGVGNSAEYAKNAYILGNENKVICESSADYLNVDNDGFTYLFGYKNSATRNYDTAIGYKSIASGGENIAIGAPYATITGYNPYDDGYYLSGLVNTQARGYKNIAIRSNVTGINNIAYNSTLTGSLMNLTSTWVTEELSKVVDNQLKNTWISGTSTGIYAAMQKNILDNANIKFSSEAFNENIITNTYSLNIVDNFSNNTILNSNGIQISAIDEYSNANGNTLIGCSNFNLNSQNIVDNLFLNITACNVTANKNIKDNILIKTTVAPCSSMSSINENIVFNSRIYGNNDSAYRGWGEGNDSNTTFTRNFIFGTHVGNYVYNTFSFSDNSNSDPDSYRLSNTIRTFNFGDNNITKAENSFVFGLQNTATSIGRSFVFGYTNNLYKTPTDITEDYIMDAFVFGISNNLINECPYSNPTLENTTIFGQHNYVKSKNTCSYNYIVGLNNSITYFTDIPSKSTIINNIHSCPCPEYETNSAAFQTTRNRIFGNGIKLSHGITDSFVAGIRNYVIDTKAYPASSQPGDADYNSIYMFGVGNIAYDGSHQLNIGYNNETSGHFAEAIGDGIKSKEQQLIVGKCNDEVDGTNRYSLTYNVATSSVVAVEPSGVIFAIGNGTYDYTTGYYTNQWGNRATGYLDKNNNVIPEENLNNEEYITRSNALIVSANGVVSANDYKTSAGYVTELIQQLEAKITALETIISSNSANWVLTSQA